MTDPDILVVTELDDPTADLVIAELHRRGIGVARFDTADFPSKVTATIRVGGAGHLEGRVTTPTRAVDLSTVRSVYWRRPTGYRFDHLDPQEATFAEAEARHGLTGSLTMLDCLYVNHPFHVRKADYKPAQLATASALGFTVPPTLITNDVDEARAFAAKHAPAVYKPLRGSGYSKDGQPRAVWVNEVDPDTFDESVAGTMHQFQARVDKVANVRVTVVGDRVFCVRIDAEHLDWRYDYDTNKYSPLDMPRWIERRLRAYLARFGLVFGCFDFCLDIDGDWVFLECNPNGQWGWMEPPTGLPFTAAFADLLERGQ